VDVVPREPQEDEREQVRLGQLLTLEGLQIPEQLGPRRVVHRDRHLREQLRREQGGGGRLGGLGARLGRRRGGRGRGRRDRLEQLFDRRADRLDALLRLRVRRELARGAERLELRPPL